MRQGPEPGFDYELGRNLSLGWNRTRAGSEPVSGQGMGRAYSMGLLNLCGGRDDIETRA